MNNIFRSKTAAYALFASLAVGAISLVLPSFTKNADPTTLTVNSQLVAPGIYAPTSMAFPSADIAWVTEQGGKIRLLRNGKLTDVVVLDLKDKTVRMNAGYEERGLLNVILHPQFATNGKFYIFYSKPAVRQPAPAPRVDHVDVVAEYTMQKNSELADPNSERIILALDKPEGNHDGGGIVFGADGYLYITFGDGGGQHDNHGKIGNGQDMNTWLGKVLRVDVNVTEGGYAVPKDNPFVGKADTKPEIWCYGFRNPYRISLDKASKQLFIGEVGQDLWEEIDIAQKGANYGWRLVEGNHCHNPATGCSFTGLTAPITEYHHSEGVSVMGGYVYNGTQLPALKGKYIFGDWTGPTWYLQKTGSKWNRGKLVINNFPKNSTITGWAEDQAGEIYYLTNNQPGPGPAGSTGGSIYKIVK